MKNLLLGICLLATTAGGCPLVPPAPVREPQQTKISAEGEVASGFIREYSKGVDSKLLGQIYAAKLQATCETIASDAESGKYFDLKSLEEDWTKRAKADLQASWDEFRQSDATRSAHRGASSKLTAEMNKLSGKEPTDKEVADLFKKLASGFKKASE
jgi:hypothetical protein